MRMTITEALQAAEAVQSGAVISNDEMAAALDRLEESPRWTQYLTQCDALRIALGAQQ